MRMLCTGVRLRFHRRCARMRSEECVCKEPIESLHLPRLGQHSSGGNGSAELYSANKTSEGCVRGMCVEKDVLRGLRILYQPVHRRRLRYSAPTTPHPRRHISQLRNASSHHTLMRIFTAPLHILVDTFSSHSFGGNTHTFSQHS
jgi:hypothetical protein